jgi:WD40 repeat protein
VSQLIYNHEEKLLIAAYSDSTIRIYDEDDAEESTLLKVLSGGHKEASIQVLAYSARLSMLASGSANGMIALWDFETGKLESVLVADECEILALEFCDPYPVLVSSS